MSHIRTHSGVALYQNASDFADSGAWRGLSLSIVRLLCLLIVTICLSQFTSAATICRPVADRPTPEAKLTPDLATAMRSGDRQQMVNFVAVMSDQVDPISLQVDVERITNESGRPAARQYAKSFLKDLAQNSQGQVLAYLTQESELGRVESSQSLWIANAIIGRAEPVVIEALAEYPEINRLLHDPIVDPERQTDEVIPAAGRRALNSFEYVPPEQRDINWNLTMLGAPDLWSSGFTGEGIVVAVIDTGVDYTHSDLVNRMWINEDEIPWNEIDDDFNGFVDDTLGWNFIWNNNDPQGNGPADHGTRCAGLVAGDGTGGTITGVAPGAQIMALKAAGIWSSIYLAIQYACDNNADIISMSVSQKWHFDPKPDYAFWRQITDGELAIGMFHANSVGNEGDEQHADPIPFNIGVPGSCPSPWVSPDQYLVGGVSAIVAAGSIGANGLLSEYSGRGPSIWEDISANWPEYPHDMPASFQDYPYEDGLGGLIKPDVLLPGDDVLSTRQGGGYLSMSGTSASCPQLAGCMALLLSARPTISPAEMSMVLQLSATDMGPVGKDNNYGAGLVNLTEALELVNALGGYGSLLGIVKDEITDQPLADAEVTVLGTPLTDLSDVDGRYEFYAARGMLTLCTKRFGYYPDTLLAQIQSGVCVYQDITLEPWPTAVLSGVITATDTEAGIEGVRMECPNTLLEPVYTDATGAYLFESFPADTTLLLQAVHFEHYVLDTLIKLTPLSEMIVDLPLTHGIFDTFEFDREWSASAPDDTAPVGQWERCDPVGVLFGDAYVQPEDDATVDPGSNCYITGNGEPGSGAYQNDVDLGKTTLTSPRFSGIWYDKPEISFKWWYSSSLGYYVDDTLRVEVSNDNGASWLELLTVSDEHHEWTEFSAPLMNYVTLSDSMRVRVVVSDLGNPSIVEAGIDDFRIDGVKLSAASDEEPLIRKSDLCLCTNPFRPGNEISFRINETAETELVIYDLAGRRVRLLAEGKYEQGLYKLVWDGSDDRGRPCSGGIYFTHLTAGANSATKRVIMIR